MTPQSIRRAAKVLRREARFIKDSHTMPDDGRWDDPAPQFDYAEMLALARQLEAMAKERKA